MIFQMDLRDGLRDLRHVLRLLKDQKKLYPAHKIMRTTDRGREVYYRIDYRGGKRKRTRIRKEDKEFRDILKSLCIEAKMEMVKNDIDLLEGLDKKFLDIRPIEIIERTVKKYPRLDRNDISDAVNELEEEAAKPTYWAAAGYTQSDYRPEEKIHTTSRGLKVRSKSEAAICEILYSLGVEFRYEEVIYISGRRIIPDFTIRRKSDGKIFYWEHFGMMDLPAYRKKHHEKMDLYEFAGIVPWDNLITTYDKDGSIDLKYIEAIVRTMLIA